MREQQKDVEHFVNKHDLHSQPAFRILDVAAEVGEIAADAVKSSAYGAKEQELSVSRDEIGDALFALLALASQLGIDAETALQEALEKYKTRVSDSGRPGSDL